MVYYPREYTDQLREMVPIEFIIGAFVSLQRGGPTRLKGCCPFHPERTPSFFVRSLGNRRHSHYHCFGCGRSGGIFQFLMELKKVTFPEAVELVAEMAKIPLPKRATKNKRGSVL